MAATTIPLPSPNDSPQVSASTVVVGQPIPPIDRIKLFSDEEWEDFVLEWADSLRERYESVERCGGAGDMGRDVIGIERSNPTIWDNYQCKHYEHALRPSDIWLEIGKLAYYCQRGEFSFPRSYVFVAPLGVGTKLSKLLRRPGELEKGLKDNWDKYCRTGITSKKEVVLSGPLLKYVEAMDYTIFSAIPPLRLIDAHAKTRWYIARFGGGLPPRPSVPSPPLASSRDEAVYIDQLWRAYGDHLKKAINCLEDLNDRIDLQDHLTDSRVEFYCAEALRAFSRDTLPPLEFEKLQNEVNFGIKDEIRAEYADGYARVLAVVKTARALQITNHSLISTLSVRDRGGICHQLANERKISWVRRKK